MPEHEYTQIQYGQSPVSTKVTYNPAPAESGDVRADDSGWRLRVTDKGLQIVNPCGSPVGTIGTVRALEGLAVDLDDHVMGRRHKRRTQADEQAALEKCVTDAWEDKEGRGASA